MINQTPQWEDIKQRFFEETGLCSPECREEHDVICRDIANAWLEKEFSLQIEKAYKNGRAGRKTFEVHDCAEMFATEIEKARKEGRDEMEEEFNFGKAFDPKDREGKRQKKYFKAGLQRAIDLICTSNDILNSKYAQNEEVPDWTVSNKITRENIKKELRSWD